MDQNYESITRSTVAAIEEMALTPGDNAICDSGALRALAALVYSSLSKLVGSTARGVESTARSWSA